MCPRHISRRVTARFDARSYSVGQAFQPAAF